MVLLTKYSSSSTKGRTPPRSQLQIHYFTHFPPMHQTTGGFYVWDTCRDTRIPGLLVLGCYENVIGMLTHRGHNWFGGCWGTANAISSMHWSLILSNMQPRSLTRRRFDADLTSRLSAKESKEIQRGIRRGIGHTNYGQEIRSILVEAILQRKQCPRTV